MQDITEYSDSELSLTVFNDEGLYRMRRNVPALLEFLGEILVFTDEQKEVLLTDLKEDEEE